MKNLTKIKKSEVKVGSWIKVGAKDYLYHGGKLFQVTEIGEMYCESTDKIKKILMTSDGYYFTSEIKEAYESLRETRDKQIRKIIE
jgi:hypothetical protein